MVTSAQGVLLGRRRDGNPPWVFPGGKVERGETTGQAAVRETAEEAGLTVTAIGEIGRRMHPVTSREIAYVACSVTAGTAHATDPEELAEVRWAALAEAEELLPGMFEPVREHLVREIGN